jgi:hypothetical protein
MTTDTGSGFRITPQAVLGVGIVVVGLVFLADNLGWAATRGYLRWWPLLIVALGLTKLAQPGDRSGRLLGGLILLVGAWLTADEVFNLTIEFEDWWPVLLVALGLVIVIRAFGARVPSAGQPGMSADSRVSEVAVWAGKQRRNASPNFRHADLTAIMGGIELDLRAAGTQTGEAVVDVFVMWGGIEIWVPPDWAVSNEVGLLMGGAEDKSTGTQAAKHRLIIRGFVIMGGLEIKT